MLGGGEGTVLAVWAGQSGERLPAGAAVGAVALEPASVHRTQK